MQTSLLSLRATLILCAFTLTLGALSILILSPGNALIPLNNLPNFILGGALLFAILGAPLILPIDAQKENSWPLLAGKSALAALWVGVAAGFLLLVSARIIPLEISGIIHATLWVVGSAWISITVTAMLPRAAAGLLFAWVILPPVSAYMLAEVFLTSPAGGVGLAQSTAPQAAALRATIHYLLNCSPATAAFGALSGALPDGSAYSIILGYSSLIAAASVSALTGLKPASRAIPSIAPQSS